LIALRVSCREKEALEEGSILGNELLEGAAVLGLDRVVLYGTGEWGSRGIVSIDADVNIIVAGEKIRRVLHLVGAITVGLGLDVGDLKLGRKVGLNVIVKASAQVALVILNGDLRSTTTGKARVGDLNASIVGVETTWGNLDVEGRVDDLVAVHCGSESVVTGLVHTRVRARVGAIAVVTDNDGSPLASGVVDELTLDVGTTLGQRVVEVIARLNGEGILATNNTGLNAGT
jgi:hypothetical protein